MAELHFYGSTQSENAPAFIEIRRKSCTYLLTQMETTPTYIWIRFSQQMPEEVHILNKLP